MGTFDDSSQTKNAIYASCNSFNIGAASGDSWGIWIFQGAGGIETTTLNYDAATANKFKLTQGTGGTAALKFYGLMVTKHSGINRIDFMVCK